MKTTRHLINLIQKFTRLKHFLRLINLILLILIIYKRMNLKQVKICFLKQRFKFGNPLHHKIYNEIFYLIEVFSSC